MKNNPVRLLKANEIECRVAMVNGKGLSLLLYKDARVDQKILDETFGAFGWKRSHQCIGGSLYCTVEILDKESGEWIAKQDVGTTGYAEKEKSLASDSFKRACFNWGIGRELYTAPFIWISADKANIQQKESRYFCNEHFEVQSIEYGKDREITELTIVNEKNRPVFSYRIKDGKEAAAKEKKAETPQPSISEKQLSSLREELKRTGVAIETVRERYRIQEPEAMSEELYGKVMAALSKTKTKAA
ncbi:MAG: hypothetical protein NC313_16610 [Butyrivibrio sp.]|nr:hypothetical protein [Butyrivibrio sp.]